MIDKTDVPNWLSGYTTASMHVCRTIIECRLARAAMGPSLGFVPTMGALHAGHLSLVEAAKKRADKVAVSIFVNPTQFGAGEDFARYPRPVDEDLQLCRVAGVDLIFLPPAQEMYPADAPPLRIELPGLFDVLEGMYRPGHFAGVCQVVAKLFNIIQPSIACFGEKDYQQLAVLRAMVRALDFPVEVIGCPTLRDADGLAMSSRNRFLSPAERERAHSISRGLFQVQKQAELGESSAVVLRDMLHDALHKTEHPRIPIELQYAQIVDADTLQAIDRIGRHAQAVVAMKVGSTRLIDNVRLSLPISV